MRRPLLCVSLGFLLTATACGGQTPEALPLEIDPSDESAEQFCALFTTLSTDAPTEPAALYTLYDEMLETAPAEIATDAAEFIRLSRKVSELVEPLIQTPELIPQALEGADPDTYAFLLELRDMSLTGTSEDTAAGRLMNWAVESCEEN